MEVCTAIEDLRQSRMPSCGPRDDWNGARICSSMISIRLDGPPWTRRGGSEVEKRREGGGLYANNMLSSCSLLHYGRYLSMILSVCLGFLIAIRVLRSCFLTWIWIVILLFWMCYIYISNYYSSCRIRYLFPPSFFSFTSASCF